MDNTIRRYRNKLFIDFSQRGENFTLNLPHKPVWDGIIRMLRKRGWKIGENTSYKVHYKCLSKYHKKGYKGNIALLMEISSDKIEIQFGSVKNLWTGVSQDFWQKGDAFDRYTELSYLEEKAIQLELKRCLTYCGKWATVLKTRDEMSAEEFILDKEKTNKHIHGGATSLDHLADLMQKEYDSSYHNANNLRDRDKKLIYCGETKYFFDHRTSRVFRGTVYHNINNMWWVILPDGKLTNIACFELFDWQEGTPRRKVLSLDEQITKIAKYYKRCYEKEDLKNVIRYSKALMKVRKEATCH